MGAALPRPTAPIRNDTKEGGQAAALLCVQTSPQDLLTDSGLPKVGPPDQWRR